MARDGSGNYSVPNTFTSGTVIASSAVNANFSDIATALTNSLARNSEGPMTAVLQMHTNGFVYDVDSDTGIKRTAANEQAIFCGAGNIIVVTTATVSVSAAITITGAITGGGAGTFGGAGSFGNTVTITNSAVGFVGCEIIGTDAGASGGPITRLYRNSGSPAASDVLGKIEWYTNDSGANKIQVGQFFYTLTDPTNGSVDADFKIQAIIGGTLTDVIRCSGAQIQIPGSLAVTGAITGASQTVTGDQSAATASGAQIATQAQMETGSATNLLVTPGRQHFHPGHPKAWGKYDASAAFSASYGVTSGTDNGTGDHTVNLSVTFSSANYCAVFGGEPGSATGGNSVRPGGQATTTLRTDTWAANSGSFSQNFDLTAAHFLCTGDL